MKKCPHCGFENTNVTLYCERCETLLPNPTLRRAHMEQTLPTESAGQIHRKQVQVQKRFTIFRILRAIFYFAIALPIAVFGLLATFATAFGSSEQTVALAFLLIGGMILGSIVTFYRTRQRRQRLTPGIFCLWVISTTLCLFMVFCLEIVFIPDTLKDGHLASIIFSSIITLYGFILAYIALW